MEVLTSFFRQVNMKLIERFGTEFKLTIHLVETQVRLLNWSVERMTMSSFMMGQLFDILPTIHHVI